jgi:hypothetical protein
MNPPSWIARLQGMDYCCFIGSKLALDFDTLVSWATRFSDFLGVCSYLAAMSSNFSLVSTRRLWFCFLSIKNPIVLSLFIKLWIVCLLGTLSSRNYVQFFRRHFLADPHFTWVSYRNTGCSIKYIAPWRITLRNNCNWKQMPNGADNCWLLLTNYKQTPTHELHRSK